MGSQEKMKIVGNDFSALAKLKDQADRVRLEQERLLEENDSKSVINTNTDNQRLKGLSIRETPDGDLGVTEDISDIEGQIAQSKQAVESKLEVIHSPAITKQELTNNTKVAFPDLNNSQGVTSVERKRIVVKGELVSQDPTYYYNRRKTNSGFPKIKKEIVLEESKPELVSKITPESEISITEKPVSENSRTFMDGQPEVDIEMGHAEQYAKLQERIKARRSSSPKIELPPRQKLVHKEDLGKSESEVKELEISKEKDEEVIQAIVEGKEIVDQKYFKDNKDRLTIEAFKLIGRQTETIPHEGDREEAPEDREAEPIDKELQSVEKVVDTPKAFSVDSRVDKKLRSFGLEAKNFYGQNPEFFKLTPEKQIYALSKIDQKLRLRSELEAKDKIDVELASSKPKKWFHFAGHLKQSFRNLRSGHRQVALRESLINQSKQQGVPEYQEDLKIITSYLSEAPELSYRKDERGKIVPCFEYVKEESVDKKHQTSKIFFNRAASRFAEIPYEWSLSGATASQREAHRKASESYFLAKKALTRALSEENENKDPEFVEENRRKIIAEIGQVNAKVNFARYITQNPDVENKSKLFFEKTLGGRVDERLKFIGAMALGYGTKWLGRSAAVLGIGAGVAAVAGGALSVYKKNREFSEKEFRARYGKNDTKELGMKKRFDSKDLYKRLENMVNQFESGVTSGGKTSDKARTLERIKTRLFVNESMLADGRVIFGSTHDEYAFSELMARAATTVEMYDDMATNKTDEEKLFVQYKTFIGDDKASNDRAKEISKAALVGAVTGATGFFVGVGMRKGVEYLTETGVFGAAWQQIVDSMGGKDIPKSNGTIRMNPTSASQPVNFPNMPKPDGLPYDINNLPEVPPTHIAEAPVGSRGLIGTIKDLQRGLWEKYGDNMPENLRIFAEGNPDRIAIDWGGYRPDQTNESIALPRGSSLVADSNGEIFLKTPDGILSSISNSKSPIEANFFDSGARAREVTSVPNVEQNPETGTIQDRPAFPENNGIFPEMSYPAEPPSGVPESFEDYKNMRVAQGYTHTETDGGDILSAEFRTGASDAGPEMVEGYTNIDGLKVDSKELKGTIDFLYNSRGEVSGLDLPKLKVPDIDKFRSNPEWFIGGDHNAPERFEMTKKLLTVRSDVEKYLAYRRILEVKSLHPDSPEFKFLNQESNKLWTAIQRKVEYQFNPNYTGFNANPIENTAPMVEVLKEQPIFPTEENTAPVNNENVPRVRTLGEEQIATDVDLENEKDLAEAHRLEVEKGATFEIEGNKTYAKAVEKYGEVSKIEGKIITFEKGYVGFYSESTDEATALKKGEALVRANSSIIGVQQEHIGIKQEGVNRIMYIFKKR